MKNSLMLMMAMMAAVLAGCKTGYQWTSKVPEAMRTVSVPNFANGSDVTELGNVVQRQILREFQREGTFKIRRTGDAAVEIQGEITGANAPYGAADRRSSGRFAAYQFQIMAKVSVIDKKLGKVLIDNKVYVGVAPVTSNGDIQTAKRNASGAAADDLARQVVDDVVGMQW